MKSDWSAGVCQPDSAPLPEDGAVFPSCSEMPRISNLRWILVLAASTAAGCGKPSSDGPKTIPIRGKVTYNGSPVADATVSFHPVGTHRSAFARTNSSGEYRLSTVAENDGAMPGEYQISVTKVVNAATTEPAADIAAPTKPPEFKSLLPEKYAKPQTSKLTAVVKSGGSEVVDLQLTD